MALNLAFGELTEVFPLVIRMLKAFNMWGDRRRFYFFYGGVMYHFVVRFLPLLIFIKSNSGDTLGLIRHLGECIFVAMLYPVFIVYIWKFPQLEALVELLKITFKKYCADDDYLQLVIDSSKFSRKVCRFFLVYASVYVPFYCLAPIVVTYYKYFRASTPMYFPTMTEFYLLDIHHNVWHYTIYLILFTPTVWISGYFLALKSMLYYSLIKYVALMFRLVIKKIQLLEQIKANNGDQDQEMNDIIRLHYQALDCVGILEQLVSPILLSQFVGCVAMWCLLLVYATSTGIGMGAISVLILCQYVALEMLAFSFLGTELTFVDVILGSLCVQTVTVLILLSLVWPTFKYYTKMTAVLMVSFLVLVIPIPLFCFKPRWPLNALIPGIVACQFIRWVGVEYEIRGKENINVANGGAVLLNHQSAIDIVLLSRLLREFRNIVPVVKKELFYALPFGIASYLVGVVFIDRKNISSAKDVMKRESVAIIRDSLKLAIFPEGTRHDNDTLLPFKKGSFHVAIDSQSLIQMVVVSKYGFLDHKKKRFGRGRVIVKILPEISTAGKTKEDINELLEHCQKTMQAEFDALSAEAKQYCHL